MVNIAKQNQYVEFAEKDSEGRNIAEKIDELDSKPAGTKLYRHVVGINGGPGMQYEFISTYEQEINDLTKLFNALRDFKELSGVLTIGSSKYTRVAYLHASAIALDDTFAFSFSYPGGTTNIFHVVRPTTFSYNAETGNISVNTDLYTTNVTSVKDIVTPL